MLPAFLRHFDFVSVGTNDLIQYTLAIDRADEAVAHLYDTWHPSVLGVLARVIAHARADAEFTQLLLAMGLRSLSMHPSQIAAIKQRVLRTDAKRWSTHLGRVLAA